MKRRIVLVASTLAALLAAFAVYYMVAGVEGLTGPKPPSTPGVRPGMPITTQRAPFVDDGRDMRILDRDKNGRLVGVYLAKRWNRRDDGSHLLIEPRVEIYHKNGQRTIIDADRAELFGEEIARGVNVRRARLEGNVRVLFDRATAPDRTPYDQRLDDLVRILVDDVEFDKERLTIRTDSAVTVYSREGDIYGRGLSISWSESPRELRVLRIEHGQYMAVYSVPSQFDTISLPGIETPTTAPAETQPAAPRVVEVVPTAAPVGTQPAAPRVVDVAPAGAPTVVEVRPPASQPAVVDVQPADVRFAAAEPNAPATPAATPGPAEPQPLNVYAAEFNDDVRVVLRNGRLHGADKLTLKFEWDDKWRKSGADDLLSGDRRTRRAAGPPKAPGAASRPTAASRPAGRGADRTQPMEIFWTGPLILQPVEHVADARRDRYQITAVGQKVVLTDPRVTAACREFHYENPQRQGHLKGAPGSPARLLLEQGADIICSTIRFKPLEGRAFLDGAGDMSRRFEKGLAQTQALEIIETEPSNRPPAGERISWTDRVEMSFAEEKVQRPDGSTATQQFIRQADFHGGVLLQQAEGGDFVRCDDLEAHLVRGQRVSAYPARAIATGHVTARQEGSDISAERIIVGFREAAGAGAARAGLDIGGRIEPTTVLAEGNVRLRHRQDPNADAVEATADRATSDRVKRTALLVGRPARIAQGANDLTGESIRLDELKQAAFVDGKGVLRFLTDRDLDGRRLAMRRPVAVVWQKAMEFQGKQNTAAFAGAVTLDSGMDHMGCEKMRVLFSEEEKPAEPATARPAGAKRKRSLAVGVDSYSRRKITMILGDDTVVLRNRRENEKGELLIRLQLTGKQLIYDADNRRMTMLGHGTFLAEDYHKPEPRRPAAAAAGDMGTAVGRPSQTGFEWNRSMQFSQTDRLVIVDGSATMVHRSGDQVLLPKGLNVPRDQWGELPAGRNTILACDNMMAKFEEPAKEPARAAPRTRPADDLLASGPDIGPLELFSASRNVNLKDGPRQVFAQRLIYNRIRDLAIIYGFDEGQPPRNASLIYEDPARGRSQTWSSPKIIWFRQNNRIVTEDVTGTGGR